MSDSTNPNPGNFANRPTDEVKGVAAMGGKASHGPYKEERKDSATENGRNPDGTLVPGSNAAKAAGHVGGMHSHDNDGLAKEEAVSELEVQVDDHPGRREDGTFLPGSEEAKQAGHKGRLA